MPPGQQVPQEPPDDRVDRCRRGNRAGRFDGRDGPAGPAGSGGLSEYAFIYNVAGRTIPLEADIVFDSNGVMTTGITHAVDSASIVLVNSGTYKITFSVSGTEPNQMGLFVDGVLVPGSVYGTGAGTQPNTGQALATVAANAVLTLRNHTSAAAVGLQALAGGTQDNSNASLAIEKIG